MTPRASHRDVPLVAVDYRKDMTPTPLPPDPLAAVERDLDALDAVPLDEQAAAFEEMHRVVTQVLAGTAQQPESNPVAGAR